MTQVGSKFSLCFVQGYCQTCALDLSLSVGVCAGAECKCLCQSQMQSVGEVVSDKLCKHHDDTYLLLVQATIPVHLCLVRLMKI